MSHSLAEQIAGLASRINNLAVKETGKSSRALLILQDELTKWTILAIKLELDAEDDEYKKAVEGITNSITLVNECDKGISKIADVINQIKGAVDAAGLVIQQVAERI